MFDRITRNKISLYMIKEKKFKTSCYQMVSGIVGSFNILCRNILYQLVKGASKQIRFHEIRPYKILQNIMACDIVARLELIVSKARRAYHLVK